MKFQKSVADWVVVCLGEASANDITERNQRFLEEALELVQACGCSKEEAHNLVEYVFNRPEGDKAREVGGVTATLAALCEAHDIDMEEAAQIELDRIWLKIPEIRAKQLGKPKL